MPISNFLRLKPMPRYQKKEDVSIICNSIPTIWCKDCKNRSSRSWDTLATSKQVWYDTKLVAMETSLEILKKNFRSIICTQNGFIWCKNCKNLTWFAFCLRHKICCHGNVPWGIGTSGSAIAEGPRDVLVSRNSATTKYRYSVALFAWSYV